ncbi:Uncharacterised protein [Mycobacteroides abscessus subsp. abscessus]|nr:Uncharacterised protein [Mycobacteroides abscessus subsp. abscessus]
MPYARYQAQRALDFAQFHAVPADLHLMVGAAQEFDGAIGPVARHIARPVPT